MGFEVRQSMLCDPEGNFNYEVTEDYDDLAKENFKQKHDNDGWTPERTMRMACSVPARLYQLWDTRLPGCWRNRNFVKSFLREHPEYARCDITRL